MTAPAVARVASPPGPAAVSTRVAPPAGLTTAEAARQRAEVGPNAMPDVAVRPIRAALGTLWAPVPWMLEAAIALQIVLGDYAEAAVIAALLAFNAAIGAVHEGRARATIAALRSRLALSASVRRDGTWRVVAASELVPGDVITLALGAVVAADVTIAGGEVLLDQAMLTGESIPVEAGAGAAAYAGALVRRGEAIAVVTATGTRTKFGRTAELVRGAHVTSAQQSAVLRVVRNLALFNGAVIAVLVAYAHALALPVAEIVPLVLTAVLASIPVALPATFSLASAVGARALAKLGVLPTRLSAVDEAATMDVLCSDKTGTLTRNELAVARVRAFPGFDSARVIALAAVASSEGGQDPVDAAIRRAATAGAAPLRIAAFVPFDPETRICEATVDDARGPLRVVKGAFASVIALLAPPSTLAGAAMLAGATADAAELEGRGLRVLAVASGPPAALALAGLVALADPPRDDSQALVAQLARLGVRTVMVTGDAPATAAIVAHAVGIDGATCPPGAIPAATRPDTFAVFAGVLPEDKFELVRTFQRAGHTVGMCGDGANDAPALRQAQIGIAVSTATDVAKSAAGVVLTEPGLGGIVAAVEEGRVTFQRIQTYTLNSIIKKVVNVLLLALGLVLTGHAILTPLLIVFVMITGDFLAMALTTDRVRPSELPNAWRIGRLTVVGAVLGACLLAFCAAVLALGRFVLELDTDAMRSLAFVTLVFGGQATIYAIREQRHLWSSRPSGWLVVASTADVLIASTLAVTGVAMTALPIAVVAATLAGAAAFAFVLDAVHAPLVQRGDRPSAT